MMVFALGISRPFSTMVVATSTSYLCAMKSDHHPLELVFAHLAVSDRDSASGTSRVTRFAIE